LIKSNLEEDAQFFIEEEDEEFVELEPLDELKEPPKPRIEYLLVLNMLFSIMIRILL
jgi:hypothetical protein